MTLCYTDMNKEYYALELGYEKLRKKRDRQRDRSKQPDGNEKYWQWKEWIPMLGSFITNDEYTTVWRGAGEDGVEKISLTMNVNSNSSLTFELSQFEDNMLCSLRAAINFSMLRQMEQSKSKLLSTTKTCTQLSRELESQRSMVTSLRQSLETFTSGGIGIEAHQRDDDNQRRTSAKRKPQSLVNPSEKVRKPRGTRIRS